MYVRLISYALAALILTACGGGGSSAPPASGAAPIPITAPAPAPAPPPPPPPDPTPAPASPVSDDAKTVAMALWRNDDLARHPKGSCASCHGPDFIDLAVMGSTDVDLRRRAVIDGATDAEAEALVTAVARMRSDLNIPAQNPRTFRPFQPGGQVLLPGLTDAPFLAKIKRDIAFGEQLQTHLPTLFGPPIETLEQARTARAEMLDLLEGTNVGGHNPYGLDLRVLKTGFAYPLWSADLHHAEGTFNDWIADVGFDAVPDRRAEWQAVMDAYVQAPTRENFWRMYAASETLTQPQLLADCTYDGRNPHLACGAAEDFNRNKFQSTLIGQHMLRESLSPHTSDFLQGPLAFAYTQSDPALDFMLDRKETVLLPANSWEIGDRARVMLDNSKDEGSFRRLLGELGFPAFVQDSIDPTRTAKVEQQDLRLSWFWIGFTQDPSFARIHASNATKVGEYMVASLLQENMHMHNAFAANMRIVAKGTLPQANVKNVNRQRHPDPVKPQFNLNYSYFVGYNREILRWREDAKAGFVVPDDLKAVQDAQFARFTGNAFRMGMHLYLDDVANGAEATDVPMNPLRSHFAHYHAGSEAMDTALMDRVDAAIARAAMP